MSKAQERRKEKDEDAFQVRVTDEQRDELMWLKWMQRNWRSVCCVNGLIMKTKNCCGCSESFVLLMHKRAKPSLHLCAPSECVREKERENSCGMRAKCLAFLPPLSVACSLIPMMCTVQLMPVMKGPRPYLPSDRKSAHFRSTTWFLFAVFKP